MAGADTASASSTPASPRPSFSASGSSRAWRSAGSGVSAGASTFSSGSGCGRPTRTAARWRRIAASSTRSSSRRSRTSVANQLRREDPPDAPTPRRVAGETHDARILEPDHATIGVEAEQTGDQAAEVRQVPDDHDGSRPVHQPRAGRLHVVVRGEARDPSRPRGRAEPPRENLCRLLRAELVTVLDAVDPYPGHEKFGDALDRPPTVIR